MSNVRQTFHMSELKILMSAGFRSPPGYPLPLGPNSLVPSNLPFWDACLWTLPLEPLPSPSLFLGPLLAPPWDPLMGHFP